VADGIADDSVDIDGCCCCHFCPRHHTLPDTTAFRVEQWTIAAAPAPSSVTTDDEETSATAVSTRLRHRLRQQEENNKHQLQQPLSTSIHSAGLNNTNIITDTKIVRLKSSRQQKFTADVLCQQPQTDTVICSGGGDSNQQPPSSRAASESATNVRRIEHEDKGLDPRELTSPVIDL
jgi:hypothetical protein